MALIVLTKELNPSKAKNSHCNGTITEFDATRLLIVNNPSAGGQSIKIKSYPIILSKIFLILPSLFSIFASSTSEAARSIVDGIISKFGIRVCFIALSLKRFFLCYWSEKK